MTRILAVAQNELMGLLRSKFFIVGLLVVPVLVGGVMAFMTYASSRVDREDRRFAVIDRTGLIYPAIEAAAARHNEESGEGLRRTGPHFLPERVEGSDDLTPALSDRVRRGDLFAFVIIPRAVLNPTATETVKYYSANTSYTRLSSWLSTNVGSEIQRVPSSALEAVDEAQLMIDPSSGAARQP